MADLEGLKRVLRSLVVSSAATMDAASLLRDYRRMLGEHLPAARYGYRDPVLFLRERCADCFLFSGPRANPVLTLIVPDSIKHIDQYVQSQKSSKLVNGKRRSVPESIIKNPPPSLIASTFQRVPPKVEEFKNYLPHNGPADTKRPEPEAPRVTQQPEPPPLVTKPVAASERPIVKTQPDTHVEAKLDSKPPVNGELSNGHVDGVYSRQRLQRFLEKRMPVYQSQKLGGSTESLQDDDSGRQTSSSLSSRSAAALSKLQDQLVRLVARRPHGVWCNELLRLYEEEYGRELNFARFRYPSVSACACAVEGLTARRAASGDWLLTLKGEEEEERLPTALRVRRAPTRTASRALLDPDDALPGIDYDPDVYPADCLSFLESIPAGSVAGVGPGDMLGVVVGEVYSPSHLWLLRLGADFDAMERCMDEMTEYYGSGEGAERVLAAGARRPGQYCSSVFEGDWHRSLIVQLVDADTVKVRHVDYGTVDTVPAQSLRPLRREWASLPAQAVRARLAGLRPAAASRRWPRAAAAHCLQLVRERRLVANVVAADHEENILEVFLIDTSTEEDVNITEQLIRAGHADPRPQPALGAREPYLLPAFSALETGATPNYAEIHAMLRDGIALEFVDAYRRHVAALLPTSSSGSSPEPAEEAVAGPPSPSPAPVLAANRVPALLLPAPRSPSPAPRSPSPEPRSPSPAPRSPSPAPCSPSPTPRSPTPPATPTPPAPPAPAPAPAPCCAGRRAPHPASCYALPACPCAAPPAPPPTLRYAPGYFRPRVCPQPAPSHFYGQYPPPAIGFNYPLVGQPIFSNASRNPHTFAPPRPLNFVPNSGHNPQRYVQNYAPNPPHFVQNLIANPQHFVQKSPPISQHSVQNSVPNPQHFIPNSTHNTQRFGPPGVQNQQRFGSSPAPYSHNVSSHPSPMQNGPNHAEMAHKIEQSPAQIPRSNGPSPAPSPPSVGSSPSRGGPPQRAEDSALRLGAEECEFFELLSRVDPGAAHRFMLAALRRAREQAACPAPAAPHTPTPAPGLNPHAPEFRSPTETELRPPPGFENFTK